MSRSDVIFYKTIIDLVFINLNYKIISFQGMVVAILFCFMHSEVIGQLKRVINMSLDGTNRQGQSMAMTQYTVIDI